MGTTLGSQFDLNTNLPLDSRNVKADVTARNAIPSTSRYVSMEVYCVAEARTYKLVGGILDANWVDVGAGSFTQETDSTTTGSAQTAALTSFVRIFTNTSLLTLAGLTAPSVTTFGVLVNRTTADIKILNDTTATAANRFLTGIGGDLTVKNGAAVFVFYDTVAQRWQVVGGSGGGGSSTKVVQTISATTGTVNSNTDILVIDASANSVLATLPACSVGKELEVFRIDGTEANTATIQRAGGDSIMFKNDLQNTYTLTELGANTKLMGLQSTLWGAKT
jgi:hypothetical protein